MDANGCFSVLNFADTLQHETRCTARAGALVWHDTTWEQQGLSKQVDETRAAKSNLKNNRRTEVPYNPTNIAPSSRFKQAVHPNVPSLEVLFGKALRLDLVEDPDVGPAKTTPISRATCSTTLLVRIPGQSQHSRSDIPPDPPRGRS